MSIKSSLVRGALVAFTAVTIAAATAGSAAAADRRVVVVNSTNHTLVRLFASNTGDPNYHDDLLGRAVMNPGSSATMDFDDGTGACWFDVKGVFNDGDKVERHNFNVCTESEMRFTGN